MALWNNFPYTNTHELNLDWILEELKKLTEEWATFENQYQGITASASTVPYGNGASVTVTGGGDTPFNFSFEIPAGKNISINSTIMKYGSSSSGTVQPGTWYDNPPTVPQGEYLWTRITLVFNDGSMATFFTNARQGLDGMGSVSTVNGVSPDGSGNVSLSIPDPSNSTPIMDSQYGSEGIGTDYARDDHSHPSDTTKLDKANGNAVGDLNAYIIEDIATQTIMPISSTPAADTIVKWDANGCLNCAEPQNNNNVPRMIDVIDNFLSLTDAQNDFVQFTDLATNADLGIVQVDGTTIDVDASGVISTIYKTSLDKLWENASPNATFSGQDIAISFTGYDMIIVMFKVLANQSTYCAYACPRLGYDFSAYSQYYTHPARRLFNVVINKITFYSAYPDNGSTADNDYMIPFRIYGVK